MTQIDYLTPPTHGFVNRRTTLLVVGIFLIIAGSLAGCLGLMTPLALFVPQPPGAPQQPVGQVIAALLIYAAIAGALIAVGIGSIRKRRWSRPIVLAASWIGVVGGVIGLIVWIFAAPGVAEMMRTGGGAAPGAPRPPPAFVTGMLIGMTVFMLLIYLVIPGLLIWLFSSEDVRATVEFYDPQPRWTDRIPIPALILVMLLALATLTVLTALPQGWFPLFGIVLHGAPATAALVVVTILCAAATYLAFRLRRSGWWMAVVLWTVGAVSWIVTVLRVDMFEIYRDSGMSEEQLRALREANVMPPALLAAAVAVMAAIAIVFALKVRRYFDHEAQVPS